MTQVALAGFSTFERATFESFFRLSARRVPAYHHCADLRECDVVILDADSATAVAAVAAAGRQTRALAIGARAPDGAAAHLARPINLMVVVKTLDALATASAAASAPAATASVLAVAAAATSPVAAPAAAVPTPPSPIAQAAARRHDETAAPTPPAAATAPPPAAGTAGAALDHILVVDDSDIALRFMAGVLDRFGFAVHLARSGEEALARTAKQDFAFVFMDVMMPGLDGFKTCKIIKQRPYAAGEEPPTIVMLTSRGSAIDKLRGTMAGCDAYLTKPLVESELLKVVGDREVRQHAFVDTAKVSPNT